MAASATPAGTVESSNTGLIPNQTRVNDRVVKDWSRKQALVALAVLMLVQISLINYFRTGLLGSDDMSAAFSGMRFVNEFDMTLSLTNLPMTMRMGMCIPLGLLQLVMPTQTALWVFPLLCAIPLIPLSYGVARSMRLSRQISVVVAAILSCTPAVIFNSSVSLTEVPLLTVTLAALFCFLQGLPTDDGATESSKQRWRYGWFFAAGLMTGILFLIKVSAVALTVSLVAYAFFRQVNRRHWPWAAVWVGCGFAAILVVEMGLWEAMSGEPLYRVNRIRLALENSQTDMRDVYRQTTLSDIFSKYDRYLPHFFSERPAFGNLFFLLLCGWGAACLFAKRYRLFLFLYGGPQLYYFWYLITFYPGTQPRYAIQLLPFLALGTFLLIEKWQWSRTGWGATLILLLVGQNLALGMRGRSNQYRADFMFFPQYSYEKTKETNLPVYVDGRTVSIFHTLNSFQPLPENRLWQYPIFRNLNRTVRPGETTELSPFPWQETNLEEAHGFVTVNLRLTEWIRQRLKTPQALDAPPPNWVLVDYAFPGKRPNLGGLIYYAAQDVRTEELDNDSHLTWPSGMSWFRRRDNSEPLQVDDTNVIIQTGDQIILGQGPATRAGIQFRPELLRTTDDRFGFIEFECTVAPGHSIQANYVPEIRLFKNNEIADTIYFPAATLQSGRHTLRFPVRLADSVSGLSLCLKFQRATEVQLSRPRVFVQHLEPQDRLHVAQYDGVELKLDKFVSLQEKRTVR